MFEADTLAIIYAGLMALAALLYAILDGYDLGVGVLLPHKDSESADTMIASIGPFWDANETWLVLAIGLLLIAFPTAHSMVLEALYLPTTVMLVGLILRGVAFDFRAKAMVEHKQRWDLTFKIGSLLASGAQGYMLGHYVMGFEQSMLAYTFAIVSALGVTAAYMLIGAAWLVMKTEGKLQMRAIWVCQSCSVIALAGIVGVSLMNLWLSESIQQKWLSTDTLWALLLIPAICALCFALIFKRLNALKVFPNRAAHQPFLLCVAIFSLTFTGLAFSFFPDIVPGKLTIFESVASPLALTFLLWGAILVVPTILGYTIFSYRVFWGKVSKLEYY